jgi:hypothetical protein
MLTPHLDRTPPFIGKGTYHDIISEMIVYDTEYMLISVVNRHGAQGILDGASNATLENEFGTHVDEEVIKQIIEKGTFQEGTVCNQFLFFLCNPSMFLIYANPFTNISA